MRKAFTLVEVLVTILILVIISSMTMSLFNKGIEMSHKAVCNSSLRQIGIAVGAYIAENNGNLLPYVTHHRDGSRTWYFGHESYNKGGEGERDLDKTKAPLAQYIPPNTVEICPAFNYENTIYKPKFKGASWAYGYNWYLGGKFRGRDVKKLIELKDSPRVILFADCAQINTFQAPASADKPMLEEFYILDPMFKTFHFRHNEKAYAVFLDGHVEAILPDSFDERLEDEKVGQIDWNEYLPSIGK